MLPPANEDMLVDSIGTTRDEWAPHSLRNVGQNTLYAETCLCSLSWPRYGAELAAAADKPALRREFPFARGGT